MAKKHLHEKIPLHNKRAREVSDDEEKSITEMRHKKQPKGSNPSFTKRLERHSDFASKLSAAVPQKLSKQKNHIPLKSNAHAKMHSEKTISSKPAKSVNKKSSLIKKPSGKLTVTEFRKLFGYSNETHRILKSRVRDLCVEHKLNVRITDDGHREVKAFNRKSTVRITQAIMAVLHILVLLIY